MANVCVVISTHTPRHLARVLGGLALQTRAANHVVISCDRDDPAICAAALEAVRPTNLPVTFVSRPFMGKSRSSQVRNNGVRALLDGNVPSDSLLLFLDGDCVPGARCVAEHARRGIPRTLVIGFRHDLTEAQTESFDPAASPPVRLEPAQHAALARRERRYRRQALLRRFGLAKPHKPKLLSANFSVRLADFLAVNGFDETYEGYGQEDDDLGRRLYAAGCRPVIAMTATVVYHQFHPTRAPGDWHESPNAERFLRGGPARCRHGITDPLPQPAPIVRSLSFRTASPRESTA